MSSRRAALAAVLVVLAFLPLAGWSSGGTALPGYAGTVQGWLQGTVLVGGAALLLALAATRAPWLRLERPARAVAALADARPGLTAALLAVLALALTVTVAFGVFDGRPLMVDEIVQVWHARLLAAGRLAEPATALDAHRSAQYIVEHGGRRFSQFPVGGPAALALGTLLGSEALVGPLAAAATVAVVFAVVRSSGAGAGVAAGAALLLALSPFAVFMGGSHMNHVPALLLLALGTWGTSVAVRGADGAGGAGRAGRAGVRAALAAGVAFGLAASVRPLDAAAFAAPALGWLAWRALRPATGDRAWLAFGAGLALGVAPLLAANVALAGHPLRFGYDVLWGAPHGLGFHPAPWGPAHTPARGLELTSSYFLRLQLYLFEAPVPSLLGALLALALAPRLYPLERYLLAAAGLLVVGYAAYWHDGFHLGPRFYHPMLPLACLLTARLPGVLGDRMGIGGARMAGWALVLAAGWAALDGVPHRLALYRSGFEQRRWDAERSAREVGATASVVLVRDRWTSEVAARLWSAGVSRVDTEAFLRRTDLCRLDLALSVGEARGLRDTSLVAWLRPLLADSVYVAATPWSPEPLHPVLRARGLAPPCAARVRSEQEGFAEYLPLLLARGPTVFVREFGRRDSLALLAYPGRSVWRLGPGGRDGLPGWTPLDRDSLLAVARGRGP